MELWVYVPEGPSATHNHPWIVCSNGNEWGQGHYGLTLLDGNPTATLDIGGGRENAYSVSAKQRVVNQSVHGNDYWQTDYDPATGTWEITYTLAADCLGDARQARAFRFCVASGGPSSEWIGLEQLAAIGTGCDGFVNLLRFPGRIKREGAF